MLRTILRNVQFALLLSSFFLFVFGVQRMQSFDFHHGMSSFSSSWSPQVDDYDQFASSEENQLVEPSFRLGAHHQVVLGREFRMGLFRFWLPRLERLDDGTGLGAHRGDRKGRLGSKQRSPAWKVPVHSRRQETYAFMVTVDSCTKSLIGSALVFAQSIRNLYQDTSAAYGLYAYFYEPATMDRCGHWLQSGGYGLLSAMGNAPDSLASMDVSCMDDEALLLLRAHHVDADVVVPVLLPALLVGTKNASHITSDSPADGMNTTSSVGSTVSILQARQLRPSRRTLPFRKSLQGVLEACRDDPLEATNQTALELPTWDYGLPCDASGVCELTRRVALATFSACTPPWMCSIAQYDKLTECLQQAPFCRQRQKDWWELRNELPDKGPGRRYT